MESDKLASVLESLQSDVRKIRLQGESPWYFAAVADSLARVNLIPVERMYQVEGEGFRFLLAQALPYNPAAALAYAASFCSAQSNSCGKFYESDCAHFMSHCLAAGGVVISGTDPGARCPAGLCIRAEELAAALYNASQTYSNVKQLNSYEEGRRGDYGFLRRFIEKSHAFLLAGAPSAVSAPVYAHTTNHCGDPMETVRILFGAYYRIE